MLISRLLILAIVHHSFSMVLIRRFWPAEALHGASLIRKETEVALE